MYSRNILTGISAAAVVLSAIPAVSYAAAADSQQVQLVSKLVDPQGQPVTDATAVVDMVNNDTQSVTRQSYKTDGRGKVTISIDPTRIASETPAFYVVSKSGFGLLDVGNSPTPGGISPSTLQPFTSLHVRVLDANGFPIAHVKVCPASINGEALYGLASDPNLADWVQTTDDYGCVTIPRLPQRFKLQLSILDNRYSSLDPQAFIQLGRSAGATEAVVKLRSVGSSRQFGAPFEEAMAQIHKLR